MPLYSLVCYKWVTTPPDVISHTPRCWVLAAAAEAADDDDVGTSKC